MTELFAIFFKLPFERITYKVISFNGRIVKGQVIDIPLAEVGIVVNLWDYLSDSDSCYDLPSNIFDLNVATKMLSGKPKCIFPPNNEPWSGVKILGRSFHDHKIFGRIKLIENNRYSTFYDWEKTLPDNWADVLVDAIKKEYEILTLDLKAHNLYDNFVNTEMRLLVDFIKASGDGICIDRDKLEKRCLILNTDYYNSVRGLETTHDFFVNDHRKITYDDIKRYLRYSNERDFNNKYLWDYIESYRAIDPFLELLYIEKYARRDLVELLRLTISESDMCKLQYDIIGTVSGRILITRPGIQYLKRTSRDIFVPNDGCKFVYADYSQFEPGVLSFLCGDQNLMNAYSEGDLYSNLAKMISNECSRDIAKKMFLSYIYGMSIDNIKNNIISTFGALAGNAIGMFFNKFPKVLDWKKSIVENSFKEKKATGLTGYVRYFSDDDLKSNIARWAPNHVIQSTASGIFKNALVKYIGQTQTGRLLVPMHDAILIEVSIDDYEQERAIISQCMRESFEAFSKGMVCKIHYDNFNLE